jgi:alkylation response protein AidB-like acyl-CoA dehydrogenase
MNFELSEEQVMLQDAARRVLAEIWPLAKLRPGLDDRAKLVLLGNDAWRAVSELGWPGLIVPQSAGGMGLGAVESTLLAEEIGRSLYAGPFTVSAILAPALLQHAAAPAGLKACLGDIALGSMRVALLEVDGDERDAFLSACTRGGSVTLSGTHVPEAGSATHFLLLAVETTAHGARLGVALVQKDAHGLAVEEAQGFDPCQGMGKLRLDAVSLVSGRHYAVLPDEEELDHLLGGARLAACGELLGAAGRALEETVAYVKVRRQFDQPVGAFQAVKHRLADAFMALENARATSYHAARLHEAAGRSEAGPEEAALALAVAQAAASDMGLRVTATCIQAHGGMGFTWENNMHLYFKRVRRVVAAGFLGRGTAGSRQKIADAILREEFQPA